MEVLVPVYIIDNRGSLAFLKKKYTQNDHRGNILILHCVIPNP